MENARKMLVVHCNAGIKHSSEVSMLVIHSNVTPVHEKPRDISRKGGL